LILKILIFFAFSFSLSVNAITQDIDSTINAVAVPQFDLPDSNFSSSGSIKLVWMVPDSMDLAGNHIFELQQSPDRDFDSLSVRYYGPDLATYISGLRNGIYHYRVRAILRGDTGSWSKTTVVSVEHHSLKLAFVLFGLGAIVFVAIVFIVVRGARNSSLPQSAMHYRQGGL
jgi:hypothetical protein